MAIYQLDALIPTIPASAWVADTAQVIGAVELGDEVSIWFGVVVRGDTEVIRIGRGSNIQDGSVLHADVGQALTIGEQVTVGHRVILHGCTVGDGCLIGMGAVVLNGARIGNNCLVGAGALVTEGKDIPDGSLVVGSPAKVIRELAPQQIAAMHQNAAHYVRNAQRFKAGLKKLS